jgi:hypothetical protein
MSKEHLISATRIRRHNKLVRTFCQSCLIKHKTCKMRLNFRKCVNYVEFEKLVTQCEVNIRDFIEWVVSSIDMTRLISLKCAIKFESIEFKLEFFESVDFEFEFFQSVDFEFEFFELVEFELEFSESEWAESESAESEWAESEWAESESAESESAKSESAKSEWVESKCFCIFYSRECRRTICDSFEWRCKIEKSREYDSEEHTLTWSTLCRDREWQYFFIVRSRRSLKIFSLKDVNREMMKMQILKMLIANC